MVQPLPHEAVPPLVRSFMVLGSEAGAGKTFVTAALVQALCTAGVQAVGMQPVATGLVADNQLRFGTELRRLAAVSAFGLPPGALAPYVLPPAGAGLDMKAQKVALDVVVDTFRILSTWADAVVIEGVDHVDPSFALQFDSADLARELDLPFVMVVGLRAGCIEPAVATVQAMVRRGRQCAGWIANEPHAPGDVARLLGALGGAMPAPCLGSIAHLAAADVPHAYRGIDVARAFMYLAPAAVAGMPSAG